MGVMLLWPIVLLAVVAVFVGLYLLLRHVTRTQGAQGIGIFAMAIGSFGILVPIFLMMAGSFRTAELAMMISGAVVFGCGTIATVIAVRKE